MRIVLLIFTLISASLPTLAQSTSQSAVESLGYGSGRYYVVIGVLGIILLGILFFLLFLERKISKLERKLDQ